MARPIDLNELRRTIATVPPTGGVAVVTRRWLTQVERDLSALAAIRSGRKATQ